MNEHDDARKSIPDSGRPARGSFWLPLLGAGILAAGGATIYQGTQTGDLRRQLAASQRDNLALRTQVSESDADFQADVTALRAQLDDAQKQVSANVARAQNVATRHADVVAGRIAQKQEQQAEQAQQLTEELGQVKESATATSANLEGVSTQVGSVKTDVDQAKSDIEETKSELQRARGDLGEMSGLIATNSKQIEMLRAMGDRNIYEFTLSRGTGAQKVGDIQVILRKADPRHNRFTLDVLSDDKRVEKKDRTINEPVQFYTTKAPQAYELVVNQIQKDKVTGYLATPKVTSASNMLRTPAQ
ncbi:MAG: hypothetical protein ABSC23_03215 [Bryobacteraceae bacterium]